MSSDTSVFSPERFGLPTREELVAHRIWDLHYHGIGPPYNKTPAQQNEETFEFVERMGVERVCPFLHVGLGTTGGPTDRFPPELERQFGEVFARWGNRMAPFVWLNPTNVAGSLAAIDRWVVNGPMVGFKFGSFILPCTHPNFVPLVERAAELKAAFYIHAWYVVGGEPRRFDGASPTATSHPGDVAELARRYPEVPLICGHSGGDWEMGIRTIAPHSNIYLEFSGSDPHSGSVDFAVAELGAERIVWGGHIPSRAYANELSKVFDADISFAQRKLILGGNLRRMLTPILTRKGVKFVR